MILEIIMLAILGIAFVCLAHRFYYKMLPLSVALDKALAQVCILNEAWAKALSQVNALTTELGITQKELADSRAEIQLLRDDLETTRGDLGKTRTSLASCQTAIENDRK
jgi:chromosome segregation ATPase